MKQTTLPLFGNPVEDYHHTELVDLVLTEQDSITTHMRYVICQMSVYYQSRLAGVGHSDALRTISGLHQFIQFDEYGLAQAA